MTAILAAAPVGAVLYDRDGDAWTRTEYGATVRCEGGDVEWDLDDLVYADEELGPFQIACGCNGDPACCGATASW